MTDTAMAVASKDRADDASALSPISGSEDMLIGTGYSTAADWFELLKPRVMSLVVFSGLVGLLVAPGHLHPVLGFTAILCIAVASGAAGAINMWYDRDIDAVMRRTAKRPIPSGRIEPGEALGFGVTLAVSSVLSASWTLTLSQPATTWSLVTM